MNTLEIVRNIKRFAILPALGVFFLAGCSGAAPGAAEDESGIRGIYRVPVAEGLDPWATYPVDGIEVEREGDYIKIEYMFPSWLAGEVQQVELEGVFTGTEASFPVTAGAMGSGACDVSGPRFVCTENLPGVAVNLEKAKANMRAAGLPADEVAQRLQVTEAFSVDPIGIVEFDMP